MLYYTGVHWGFSAFALALGSSYFQRLLEGIPLLSSAARAVPAFAPYLAARRAPLPPPTGSEKYEPIVVDVPQVRCRLFAVRFMCSFV